MSTRKLLLMMVMLWCCDVTGGGSLYGWSIGRWGQCVKAGCGEGGTQTRPVWCSHKSGLTVPPHHCDSLSKPPDTKACFKICPLLHKTSQWSLGEWSLCTSRNASQSCQPSDGVQSRTVECVCDQSVIRDFVCVRYHSAKPESQRVCDVRCPQDCVVGDFLPWTTCQGCKTSHRIRLRPLIVAPRNGGTVCPPLQESQFCHQCVRSLVIRLSKWSMCMPYPHNQDLPDHVTNSTRRYLGYQTRYMFCLNTTGHDIIHRFCFDKFNTSGLNNYRTCVLPQDCVVSHWLPWRPINTSCVADDGSIRHGYMSRDRHVTKLPMGGGKACPRLRDTFQVTTDVLVQCPRYEWMTSQWSKCNVLRRDNAPRTFECGEGVEVRNAVCVRYHNSSAGIIHTLMKHSGCSTPVPNTTRPCHVTCTQNCTVSDWSPWSPCSELCQRISYSSQIKHSIRHRTILQSAGGYGLPCPNLNESRPCIDLDCNRWNITNVEPCKVHNVGVPCGRGFELRNITCGISRRMSTNNCRQHERPPTRLYCYVPCPDDCVLSPWSEWEGCESICDGSKVHTRVRHRSVFAWPGKTGRQCPEVADLSQTENCPPHGQCHTFSWRTSNWSSCVMYDADSDCGAGVRGRAVSCHRSDNTPVTNDQCSPELKPRHVINCSVECVADCKLTDWSDWSACSATCVQGSDVPSQVRYRAIIQQPILGGFPCPTDLRMTRLCDEVGHCDSRDVWMTSEWGPCVPPTRYMECGSGLRTRDVVCQTKSTGKVVALDRCLQTEGAFPRMFEQCKIGCEPRIKCDLTQWTSFGACVGGCTGFRIRTRKLLEGSKSERICRNISSYPLSERVDCKCRSFGVYAVTSWSDCIVGDRKRPIGRTKRSTADKYDDRTNSDDFRLTLHDTRDSSMFVKTDYVETISIQKTHAVSKRSIKTTNDDFNPRIFFTDTKHFRNTKLLETLHIPLPAHFLNSHYLQRKRVKLKSYEKNSLEFNKHIDSHIVRPKPNFYHSNVVAYNSNLLKNVRLFNSQTTHNKQKTRNIRSVRHYRQKRRMQFNKRDRKLRRKLRRKQRRRKKIRGEWARRRKIPRLYRMQSESAINSSVNLNGTTIHEQTHKLLLTGNRNNDTNSYHRIRSNRTLLTKGVTEDVTKPVHIVDDVAKRTNVPDDVTNLVHGPDDVTPTQTADDVIKHIHASDDNIKHSYRVSDDASIMTSHIDWCGSGQRFRMLGCAKSPGDVRPARMCALKSPFSYQACTVPCPVDCVMSSWSPWQRCDVTCGEGTSTRYRTVVRVESHGGRECSVGPKQMEYQTSLCRHNCTSYGWIPTPWRQCYIEGNSPHSDFKIFCGLGVRARDLRCLVYVNHEPLREVSPKLCPPSSRPVVRERCYIPCVGECVLGDWSPWSLCSPACNTDKNSTRTRQILRKPGFNKTCDVLNETTTCVLGRNCHDVTWRVSAWTSCRVLDDRVCGLGRRERYVTCVGGDGGVASPQLCARQRGGPPQFSLSEYCHVTCDVDCVTSSWSQWSECSVSCDQGTQTRVRRVIQPPQGHGRKCVTSQVMHHKPCFSRTCFRYVLSDWTPCLVKNMCGYGTKTRDVTCQTSRGAVVDLSNCHVTWDDAFVKREMECRVRCPGQCSYTEWTQWSDCFVDCDIYETGERDGYQARSRGVFPGKTTSEIPNCVAQSEYRKCTTTKCYRFDWQVSPWNSNHRNVWCQRSDGLNVTGGCRENTKPSATLRCGPQCTGNCSDACVCPQPLPDNLTTDNYCAMYNYTDFHEVDVLYFPDENVTNFWMYAVVISGIVFIVCVVAVLYLIWRESPIEEVRGKVGVTPSPSPLPVRHEISVGQSTWQVTHFDR